MAGAIPEKLARNRALLLAYIDGDSIAVLAARFELSHTRVAQILSRARRRAEAFAVKEARMRQARPEPDEQRAARMLLDYALGASVPEISEREGLSLVRVKSTLQAQMEVVGPGMRQILDPPREKPVPKVSLKHLGRRRE